MSSTSISPNTSVQFIDVEEDYSGQRLDNFLIARLKGVPKSKIYQIIRKGEVRVNKKRKKAEYRLESGDAVRVPPIRVADPKPVVKVYDKTLKLIEDAIIYEDESFMAINKPSGIAVHGGSGVTWGLIEAVRQIRPDVRRLELVHRLDRDTSGIILIAKKGAVLKVFHQYLLNKQMSKIYHALVVGRWPKHKREIDVPLKKIELSSGERIVKVDGKGKACKTEYRVLDAYKGYSLVEASPITGRTHQIRVHCQFAGSSIVGDQKYCSEADLAEQKVHGFNRLCLHARELRFKHPETGKQMTLVAEYGPDLNKILSGVKQLAAK
ncbi:23S rRNA pseudouridine(955/2504/2580) synthase RluC [Litoribacillus peritrichatus]|uniref:Pseudouridine synthase n=1 Tax=Litoribacillus peritrichatus TaxID=718191 RepID=A0ABP7N504_9GAMM